MNSNFGIVFFILAFSFCACHFYKEYDKESFPTYAWQSGQELRFHPVIEEVGKPYTLALGIRHLFGFEPSSIAVQVKLISPSGKESVKDYEFLIRDKSGEYIGTCGGDLCDLETPVDENIIFEEPGEYAVVVTHGHPGMKITGIMEFGIILDEQ